MYARIEDNTVVEIFGALPVNFECVSNFNTLPDEELIRYGWLPVIDLTREINPKLETLDAPIYKIEPTRVVMARPVRNLTEAELKAQYNIRNHDALTEIVYLEGKQGRIIRELLLGDNSAAVRLQELEIAIDNVRLTLT